MAKSRQVSGLILLWMTTTRPAGSSLAAIRGRKTADDGVTLSEAVGGVAAAGKPPGAAGGAAGSASGATVSAADVRTYLGHRAAAAEAEARAREVGGRGMWGGEGGEAVG